MDCRPGRTHLSRPASSQPVKQHQRAWLSSILMPPRKLIAVGRQYHQLLRFAQKSLFWVDDCKQTPRYCVFNQYLFEGAFKWTNRTVSSCRASIACLWLKSLQQTLASSRRWSTKVPELGQYFGIPLFGILL